MRKGDRVKLTDSSSLTGHTGTFIGFDERLAVIRLDASPVPFRAPLEHVFVVKGGRLTDERVRNFAFHGDPL